MVAAQLGRFLILSGEPERAAPHLEHALALAEALDLPETLAQALTSKAILLVRDDRLNEARIMLEGALAHAQAHDLHETALRAYNNLMVVLDAADRIGESFALLEQAIELARRVGDRGQESTLVGGSAFALYLVGGGTRRSRGRPRRARWRARRTPRAPCSTSWASGAIAVSTRTPASCSSGSSPRASPTATRSRWLYKANVARMLRAEGRHREALDTAEQALAARDVLGMTNNTTKAAITEALECSLALGDVAKTQDLLGILDALRPGELTPWLRAIRADYRGRLAAQTGSPDAGAHFQEAERVYEGLGTPFFLAVTQLAHAEWLAEQAEPDEAAALKTAARDVFERLRAVPWLERADRLELDAEMAA